MKLSSTIRYLFHNQLMSPLCWRLAWRLAVVEFSLRNEGSYLGNIWYVINPLLLFAVLYFVFVDRIGGEVANYPAYLILGILVYNFFSRTTLELTSIIKDSQFIKSFSFPYETLVLSVVLKHLFGHLFESVVFFVLLSLLGVNFVTLIPYLLVLLLFATFLYGLGLILSSITVYFVDIGNVWQFFSLLLLFFTPVFYFAAPGSIVYQANLFNPLFHFITAAREVVMYLSLPDISTLVTLLFITVISLVVGQIIFNKCKSSFPELI